MPADRGAKKNNEKAKRKREAAQKEAAAKRATAIARQKAMPVEQFVEAKEDPGAPFKLSGFGAIDYDELDELTEEARAHLSEKKWDEAAKVAATIVRKFPNEPDGWQYFSAVWEARGDVHKALAEMERAEARVSADDDATAGTIGKHLRRLRAAAARAG
jgi:hypothetical protein